MDKEEKKRNIIKGIVTIAVIVIITVLVAVWFIPAVKDKDGMKAYFTNLGWSGRIVFILFQILQVVVAVLPGGPVEILGGYIYGSFEGTILSIIGCSIGSLIVFLVIRRFGKKFARLFVSEEKIAELDEVMDRPEAKTLFIIFFIIPGTPKDLLSYYAGFTDISFPAWCLICTLGRLPGVLISSLGGSAISNDNKLTAILWFVLLFAISCIGAFIYKKLKAKNGSEEKKFKFKGGSKNG